MKNTRTLGGHLKGRKDKTDLSLPDHPSERSRCKATRTNGKPCNGWARLGGYCHIHDPDGTYQMNTNLSKIKQVDSYKDYLRTEHWNKTRKKALKHYGYQCAYCGSTWNDAQLQVHHLTYETLWNETMDDLIVLCKKCHGEFHDG